MCACCPWRRLQQFVRAARGSGIVADKRLLYTPYTIVRFLHDDRNRSEYTIYILLCIQFRHTPCWHTLEPPTRGRSPLISSIRIAYTHSVVRSLFADDLYCIIHLRQTPLIRKQTFWTNILHGQKAHSPRAPPYIPDNKFPRPSLPRSPVVVWIITISCDRNVCTVLLDE